MPPEARLGDAAGLQALREPTPRLDLSPRHILQQDAPTTWRRRLSRQALPISCALAVHACFALALFFLLSFREPVPTRELEIPVEVVVEKPEGPKPATSPSPGSGTPAAPKSEPAKAPDPIQQALAPPPVAPDPKPPAPPSVQPLPPPTPTPPAPAQDAPEAPKLVAPPPEPTRAATQDRETKAANLAPDVDHVDQATREARPTEVPQTLTTPDPKAAFAVPLPAPAKPPEEKPTPDIPAKVRSETEKLAAALPMDTSAMPSSFRAVLAGNGAQVSAAYKGLVYGRFNRSPEIGERARRQRLKGQVIVAFSIDDTGQIKDLSVLQSSGNAAVDALGLALIRSAAPFPPPPPDAQRSFTPALSFGE